MTTSPSEYLNRVFPRRFLFRGAALKSLGWTVLEAASLAVLLLVLLLLLLLIETRGRVHLTAEQTPEFYALVGEAPEAAAGATSWNLAPVDAGLRAVAWEVRERRVSGLVVWACRRTSRFDRTGAAFLTLLTVAFLAGILMLVARQRAQHAAMTAATHTGRQLRESLHRHSLRMGTSDLFDAQTGDVLRLFTTEVEAVQHWIASFITRSARIPLQLLVLVGVGCLVDGTFFIECGVPLLAIWLFVARRRSRHRAKVRLRQDRASSELKLVSEGIFRSRLIRGFLLDSFEHMRFERHLDRYEDHAAGIRRLDRQLRLVSGAVVLLGCVLVAYIAGGRVLTETEYSLSMAEVAFLVGTLVTCAGPLGHFVGLIAVRTSARTAIDRVYRYLNTIPEVGQAVGAEFLQPLEKNIEFHEVTYRAGGRKLLDALSLKIPAMGTTAVVAFDRREAIALASLLPRFIDPTDGRVTIDGHDIEHATLESLRSEVVWVGGRNAWFTGSVLENIAGGDRFSLSQVTDAAKRTHAHHFVQKFAQGYETIVGEHGEQLTESQGFRLALARALLRDPALLVIEEPVDVESPDEKALLEDACRNAARGRTVVYLPARLRTLKAVDRIVLLNHGRVEVVGTHEALLKTSSLYRHWEYLHFNEFRKDVGPLID